MYTQTKESQEKMTPQEALNLLKKGNKRFIENARINRDYQEQIKITSKNQFPFATILHCIDSRVSAELLFDRGIGDVFSIRIAGNFVNDDILGSMEFGCRVAGTKLLVVLGHTHCGAVKGACDHVELGNLTGMLAKLQPAIDGVEGEYDDRSSKNDDFVQKVAELNVKLTIDQIRKRSSVLQEMEEDGEIEIVGGMYDIHTGEVTFY